MGATIIFVAPYWLITIDQPDSFSVEVVPNRWLMIKELVLEKKFFTSLRIHIGEPETEYEDQLVKQDRSANLYFSLNLRNENDKKDRYVLSYLLNGLNSTYLINDNPEAFEEIISNGFATKALSRLHDKNKYFTLKEL